MKTYGEVIKRISEIINLSNSFLEKENSKDNFSYISHHYISNEYAKEYLDLLETEKIFYNLMTNSNATIYNQELMNECLNLSNTNPLYNTVYEMLKSSLGKSPLELKEYNGYYVLKDDYNEFLRICHDLKIGPFKKASDLEKHELESRITASIRMHKEQEERINKYNPQKEEKMSTLFDEKYANIILLGINGFLFKDMILAYRNELSSSEYQYLLDELYRWQIIKKEDLKELTSPVKYACVNDLISYFARKENLEVDELKLLIPAIGQSGYNYLLEELLRLKVISLDDFMRNVDFINGHEKKMS